MKNMMLLKVLGIINKLPSRKKMLKMQLLLTIFVFSGYYLSALCQSPEGTQDLGV